MSTTTNSSSLFSSYKDRLSKAKVGFQSAEIRAGHTGVASQHYVDEKSPILRELDTELAKKDADLNAAQSNISRNQGASSARSAFAAGAASRSKKLFRRKGGGSYAAIGKTDAATSKAVADREKEIIDLRAIDPSMDVRTGQRLQTTMQFGTPFKIW